jgi:vitamin B12 transporter
MRLYAATLLLVALSAPVGAEESGYEVEVHAPRWRRLPADDPSGFTSVVNISAPSPGDRLEDLLAEVPGLRFKSEGADGRMSLTMRGADGGRTVVYLDGIRLSSPGGMGVDLSLISPEQLGAVEVRRSAASARFGSSALGGALVLRSAKLSPKTRNSLSVGYGSFNALHLQASRHEKFRSLRYLISGGFRRGSGDFVYVDENGQNRLRENNDSQKGELLVKADLFIGEHWRIDAINHFALAERGAPGMSQYPSATARQYDLRNLTSLRATRYANLTADDSIAFSVSHRYETFRFDETSSPPIHSHNQNYAPGLNAVYTLPMGRFGRLQSGLDLRADLFRDSATSNPWRLSVDLWAASQIKFAEGAIIVAPAFRLATASDFGASLIPKLGLSVRPFNALKRGNWLRGFELLANIGRAFRYPSFQEMYVRLDGFGGNPNLDPEDAVVLDAGFRFSYGGVAFESAYFHRRMKNTILFAPVGFVVRADNYSKAVVEGLETALTVEPGYCLAVNAAYTVMRTAFGEPEMQLPGHPGHRASGQLNWAAARCKKPLLGKEAWPWLKKLEIWFSLTGETKKVLSRFNTTEEEGRLMVSAGVRYGYRWLSFSLEAKNLLDKRDALDSVGFPLAPLQIWGGLRADL